MMNPKQWNPIKSSIPLQFNQEWIDNLFFDVATVWVGFSGGVDSHVLLQSMVSQLSAQQKKKVTAIHIHHGLSHYADDWLSHCEQVCQKLGVRFIAKRVQLKKHASIEEAARNARYQIFETIMSSEDVLLLAHHSDDQAETVLFRLLRGTGGKGLSGMPYTRTLGDQGAFLIRPFLEVSRANIESYAHQEALNWIQDDSNIDEHFTRNFLRHRVVPIVKERFPKMDQAIASSAQRIETDYFMLSQFAYRQLEEWCNDHGGLDLSIISNKTLEERLFWLRYFLQGKGVSLPHAQLQSIEQMFFCDVDRQPEFQLNDKRIMRHQNAIYLLPADQIVTLSCLTEGEILRRAFDEIQVYGCDHCELKERPSARLLTLEQGKHRKLKKWLNDLQIPVWWREHLPYIFVDDELVAIGDLWHHPNYLYIQVTWRVFDELPLPIVRPCYEK